MTVSAGTCSSNCEINPCNRPIDRLDDLVSPFGESKVDTPAVLRIGAPFEIAAVGEDVDHLAHGLFGHAELNRQVLEGPFPRGDIRQHQGAIARQVIDADRVQLGTDGVRVDASRAS